jgi:lipopolysaccharide/colanic/teichoic acid biosynthesis glycosyltransferase
MPFMIQRVMAALALLVLLPVVAIIAIAIRIVAPGPVIHRAQRVGRGGTPFVLLKFRSMAVGAKGSAITAAGDPRVTPIGRRLRRTKLDELPQLWNVVRGEMAIVGPRPEDPRYVDLDDALQREVLSVPPGMTSPTALAFADEERRVAAAALAVARAAGREQATEGDIETAYRTAIQPQKLRMDASYVRTRSARGDLRVITRTFGVLLGPRARS